MSRLDWIEVTDDHQVVTLNGGTKVEARRVGVVWYSGVDGRFAPRFFFGPAEAQRFAVRMAQDRLAAGLTHIEDAR